MTIVNLKDGTSYLIDTDSESNARYVVDYKLRQRLDHRQISSVIVMEDAIVKKDSEYYNSGDRFDGIPLKCKTGWSYKWSDVKCAEFR